VAGPAVSRGRTPRREMMLAAMRTKSKKGLLLRGSSLGFLFCYAFRINVITCNMLYYFV